jgi:hypothetical protein
MPFTISHIAAVLPAYRPLVRARLFTAAVIGSMVPDFGILLPGGLSRLQTHIAADQTCAPGDDARWCLRAASCGAAAAVHHAILGLAVGCGGTAGRCLHASGLGCVHTRKRSRCAADSVIERLRTGCVRTSFAPVSMAATWQQRCRPARGHVCSGTVATPFSGASGAVGTPYCTA